VRGPAIIALFAACLATAGVAEAPPAGLADLYRMASAYEVSATRRSCAAASLGPRLTAARARMEQARARMIAAYGAQYAAGAPPIATAGNPCADPRAAANATANFEEALARLEAAFSRAARG
jgi:hypothetical protein